MTLSLISKSFTSTGSAAAAALLAASMYLTPAVAQESAPPAPAPKFVAPAGTSLQGNEGVHIQTMCTNCNSANIDLGGLGNELLPLDLDGIPVLGGMMTIYTLNVTPAALTSNIEVGKGPGDFAAPAEAVGGAIHISSTRPVARPTIQAGLEYGGWSWKSAQLNGQWTTGGLTLSGRGVLSKSAPIDPTGDGYNITGALDRRYGDADAEYRFTGGARLRAGYWQIREDSTEGHGKYSFLASRPVGYPVYLREDAFVEMTGSRLSFDLPIGRSGLLTLRSLYSNRTHDIWDQTSRPTDPLVQTYHIEDRNFAAEARYEQPLSDSWLLSAGISDREQKDPAIYTSSKPNIPGAGASLNTAVTLEVKTRSADAGVQATLSDQWSLRFGARYDDWDTAGNAVSPRARLTYHPARAWTLTLSAGGASRAARPIFEEICCGQQLQPNALLQLEKSVGTALEAVYQPRPEFRIGAYLHRTTFDNYITRMVATSLVGIQTYVQGNVPEARFTGLTLTSKIIASWATFDLAYSALDAVNPSGKPVTVQYYPPSSSQLATSDILFDKLPYHASETASLGISFKPGNFNINLTGQYQGHMYIQHWNAGTSGIHPPQWGLYEDLQETPSFVVVNARVVWRVAKLLAIHAGVDNITDRIQSDLTDPSNDYNWGPIRGRYIYGGITINP